MQTLHRISLGEFALPENYNNLKNPLLFYNGRALNPETEFTTEGLRIKIPYAKASGLVTDVVMLWSLPEEKECCCSSKPEVEVKTARKKNVEQESQ